MLTGASPIDDGKPPKASLAVVKGARMSQHYLLGGQGALPFDSQGKRWTGDNVFSSGDLIEDLTHNYFLETGARSGKLRVYEMVEHPAARADGLPARTRRRPTRLRTRARSRISPARI